MICDTIIWGDFMSIELLDNINGKECSCKKEHVFNCRIISGEGAIKKLPGEAKNYNAKKVYLIADKNTYAVAGETAKKLLEESGIKVFTYIFKSEELEPDEANVGLAIMNFPKECDLVLGVGSGVINDISKITANVSGKPYIIVATAPSMDGYASGSSSMTMEGLKISLNSKCPDSIIGDTDILCTAPIKMMQSGLGDMLAKYVSILEWRIANLITGEYYCEKIADLVRKSLKKCVDNAGGLLKKDKKAVEAVFEGLVSTGVAMNIAGVSRPASGIEHYISHVWDMRKVSFGTYADSHGIQCAMGTLIAAGLYEKLALITPDAEKAKNYAESFSFYDWSEKLREFLGKGAEAMIALEEKEKKYDEKKHKERLKKIIDNWESILTMIKEELPSYNDLLALFEKTGLPSKLEDINIDEEILPLTIKASKDIRDKYVLSRLLWDLGVLDEII